MPSKACLGIQGQGRGARSCQTLWGRLNVTWLLNLQSSDATTAGLFVDATFQLADVEVSQWPSPAKHPSRLGSYDVFGSFKPCSKQNLISRFELRFEALVKNAKTAEVTTYATL